MLCDEPRVPSHLRLFTVIFGVIRCNPGFNKLKDVLFDGFETFGGDVNTIFLGQLEFGSEFGFFKEGELLRYN